MKRLFLPFLSLAFAVGLLAAGMQAPLRAQTPTGSPVKMPPAAHATPAAATPPAATAPSATTPVATPPAATTAVADNEDIHDIRGPKPIPAPELWFLWLAGGAALAALAYGAWRWHRHVRTAPRHPYEIALDRLEKARALMKVETAREFSIEVSEIVRGYIEARFDVRAARQTTEEFLHDLLEPSDALLAGHQELLADFLHHCDLAKFARWILSLEEMERMHASARTFVLETGKPAAKPATAPVQPEAAHA